ncbi:molybdopterin-dependent oxidoreductase [Desulfovibrio sp. OttesenSCG-928-I05]|nr:molybdopterin-dependent oxidoreductase [Desulfovibrio sp. OttesenSCG-928-I05]
MKTTQDAKNNAPTPPTGPQQDQLHLWSDALGIPELLHPAAFPATPPPGLRRAIPAAHATGGTSDGMATHPSAEEIVFSGCTTNCGSQCTLRMVTKDGRIIRVESDDREDAPDRRAIRACLRGRSIRQHTYSPDRIKTPMRRIPGTRRGEGKFEAISWDEAIKTVAGEWKRVLDTYGPEAVFKHYGSGTTSGALSNRDEWSRLANLMGGYLDAYGSYSTAQISVAIPYLYGNNDGNTINDMANSRLVVMFGANIMETRQSGGGLSYELLEAKRAGNARIIMIDPRYSDSMATVGDEWIPIRPGSDGALSAAIAHVLLSEGLVDQEFLDRYCVGFDESTMPAGIPPGSSYKAYILGQGPDATPKTPGWAAAITGCPAETIIRLAREIGTTKPCCILQGWGPQRHACGDTSTRAIAMLAILTGNVGIPGGNSGSGEGFTVLPFKGLPTGDNPVRATISFYTWINAIEDYTQVTATRMGLRGKDRLETGIKFLWNTSGNALINQHSDCNATRKILEDDSTCECIVVVDTRLTPSAMFADILLPSVTPPEQDDFIRQGYHTDQGALLLARKAVEPLFDAKPQYEICTLLARELGRICKRPDLEAQYTQGRTQLDWIRWLYAKARRVKPDLPESFDDACRTGLFTWFPPTPHIAYKAFRNDPEANPLDTPSGKIEIFSKRLWELNRTWELPEGERIHPIPVYEKTPEGPDDEAGKRRYPLQLIGHHYKGRTHSSYANLPWLGKVAPQQLWINPIDAAERGIRHGDSVTVFNDRGSVIVPAKVTPRIMPGVLSLPQGAWYKPDAQGIDRGACINTLTVTRMTPLAKGNPQHTNLVEVVRSAS